MIVHHDPKRHALPDALLVQGDSQFVRVRSKASIGDNYVRTATMHKPEDNGIRRAFRLALDKLS
jgi:hypothetical protein